MKTNKFLFIVILVLTVLAIVLLAATITGTADAADDCPKPPMRPQVWLPLVGQAHIAGMIDCIQHPYKCLGK